MRKLVFGTAAALKECHQRPDLGRPRDAGVHAQTGGPALWIGRREDDFVVVILDRGDTEPEPAVRSGGQRLCSPRDSIHPVRVCAYNLLGDEVVDLTASHAHGHKLRDRRGHLGSCSDRTVPVDLVPRLGLPGPFEPADCDLMERTCHRDLAPIDRALARQPDAGRENQETRAVADLAFLCARRLDRGVRPVLGPRARGCPGGGGGDARAVGRDRLFTEQAGLELNTRDYSSVEERRRGGQADGVAGEEHVPVGLQRDLVARLADQVNLEPAVRDSILARPELEAIRAIGQVAEPDALRKRARRVRVNRDRRDRRSVVGPGVAPARGEPKLEILRYPSGAPIANEPPDVDGVGLPVDLAVRGREPPEAVLRRVGVGPALTGKTDQDDE